MNCAVIVGNVGQDPKVNQTTNGTPVANFSVATNEYFAGKSHTEWHRVVVFGQPAEFVDDHVKKGSCVEVVGSIRTREWEDKEGNRRFNTEIVAQTVRFGPGAARDEEDERNGRGSRESGPTSRGAKRSGSSKKKRREVDEDEIPFD